MFYNIYVIAYTQKKTAYGIYSTYWLQIHLTLLLSGSCLKVQQITKVKLDNNEA